MYENISETLFQEIELGHDETSSKTGIEARQGFRLISTSQQNCFNTGAGVSLGKLLFLSKQLFSRNMVFHAGSGAWKLRKCLRKKNSGGDLRHLSPFPLQQL